MQQRRVQGAPQAPETSHGNFFSYSYFLCVLSYRELIASYKVPSYPGKWNESRCSYSPSTSLGLPADPSLAPPTSGVCAPPVTLRRLRGTTAARADPPVAGSSVALPGRHLGGHGPADCWVASHHCPGQPAPLTLRPPPHRLLSSPLMCLAPLTHLAISLHHPLLKRSPVRQSASFFLSACGIVDRWRLLHARL